MKLTLTLEQTDGRHEFKTTIIREHPDGDLLELITVFRHLALAAGFHPDNVNEAMPQDE
jgi:hypothetical protein